MKKMTTNMPINKKRMNKSGKAPGLKVAFKVPTTLQKTPAAMNAANSADSELRKLMTNGGVPRKRMA